MKNSQPERLLGIFALAIRRGGLASRSVFDADRRRGAIRGRREAVMPSV